MSLIQHAQDKMWDQVAVAVRNGEDVNMTLDGDTAMNYAAKAGNHYIIKILLNQHANPNVPDSSGYTPLMRAIIKGYGISILTLIDGGADLHSTTVYQGATPLHWVVAYCPNDQVVQTLLAKGVNPNALCSDGWTALDVARRLKHDNMVRLLENITDSPYNQFSLGKKIGMVITCGACVVVRHYEADMDRALGIVRSGWGHGDEIVT